jgi:prepilin-type processing-associated H-X9-DG protein
MLEPLGVEGSESYVREASDRIGIHDGNLGKVSDGPNPQGGGGWADPLNYIATNGSVDDGSGFVPGACAVNCSNDSEIYSFHSGGSNVVFGDGSVQFISATLNLQQIAALLSKAGGEMPVDYNP